MCSVNGCEESVYCRGMCHPHYDRARRQGMENIPMPTPEERFWAKVDKNGPLIPDRPDLGPCWLWTAKTSRGYPQFAMTHKDLVYAHILSYEWNVGEIPEGETLDHLCHTLTPDCTRGEACLHRSCVNWEHLEAVPLKENVLRSSYGPSAVNARKEECIRGHPLSGANLYIHKGKRFCRICRNAAQQEYRQRNTQSGTVDE